MRQTTGILPKVSLPAGVQTALSNFWSVLWSSEWLANVGLPLLVAGAALWFAVHALSTQLDSDRRLAREERRQAHAERFAAAIDKIADELERYASDVRNPAHRTPVNGGYMDLLRLMDPLTKATLRAMKTLGNSDAIKDVSAFEQSLRHRFSRATTDHVERARNAGYTDEDIREALAHLIDEYVQTFRVTADNLEDWDGSRHLPVSAVRGPQVGVAFPSDRGTFSTAPNPPALLGEVADDYYLFESYVRVARTARTGVSD
ncbi:hypothetical protein ACFTWF_22615 [Rhodococcus sp. NPDC056960]|uniref:hypothetical protein n=1 Tax=Rhodococcus sp. NPDC056960 TaxID=3345982 RepID=UPI003634A98B